MCNDTTSSRRSLRYSISTSLQRRTVNWMSIESTSRSMPLFSIRFSVQRSPSSIITQLPPVSSSSWNKKSNRRGNTPADWVWLVPPVSSGMSVVFHQEMLNYVVKPRVLDQRDPWTYYTGFRRAKETSQTSSTVKRRHRWTLLHAARSIIGLALRAAKKRVAVHVLYASASGTAQSYAQQMSKRLAMDGYQTTLMMLDKYPFRQVTDTRALVLIITSTFGQGNAPEGGTEMEEWLKDEIKEVDERSNQSAIPRLRRLSSVHWSYEPVKSSLRWCTYAVCAIGSSAYPFFCGFGKLIDQTFRTLGAHQLVPLATCDALNQQYKSFNEWEETTVMTLKKMYPHVPHPQRRTLDHALPTDDEQISFNKSLRPSFIKLEFFAKNDANPLSRTIGPFTKENPYKAVVLQNIELTGAANVTIQSTPGGPTSLPAEGEGSTTLTRLAVPSLLGNVNNDEHRSVRRVRLETPGLTFYPGDHVCILPENSQAHVVAIILACGWQRGRQRGHEFLTKPCSLGSLTNNQYVTLRQILTQYVDLVTTPRPHLLDTIATYATDNNQQRQLFELGKGGQRYVDWCVSLPTIKEMLDQFPSVRIPLEELIQVTSDLSPGIDCSSACLSVHFSSYHHCNLDTTQFPRRTTSLPMNSTSLSAWCRTPHRTASCEKVSVQTICSRLCRHSHKTARRF